MTFTRARGGFVKADFISATHASIRCLSVVRTDANPTSVQQYVPVLFAVDRIRLQRVLHFLLGYDHVVRSAAETLATYNRPPEQPNHFNHQTRHAPPNSIRRSGNHAPGALNSARMYYCEICRIACGGHATYQAHLNGSKHKKKELNAQNSASSNSTTTKSTVPSFRCELCDITCTSSDAYKAHIEGSKHEKVNEPLLRPTVLFLTSFVRRRNCIANWGKRFRRRSCRRSIRRVTLKRRRTTRESRQRPSTSQ